MGWWGSVAGSFETLGVSSRREETSLVSVSEGRSISVERGLGLSQSKAGWLEGKQRERVLKGRDLGHKRGAQRKEDAVVPVGSRTRFPPLLLFLLCLWLGAEDEAFDVLSKCSMMSYASSHCFLETGSRCISQAV